MVAGDTYKRQIILVVFAGMEDSLRHLLLLSWTWRWGWWHLTSAQVAAGSDWRWIHVGIHGRYGVWELVLRKKGSRKKEGGREKKWLLLLWWASNYYFSGCCVDLESQVGVALKKIKVGA